MKSPQLGPRESLPSLHSTASTAFDPFFFIISSSSPSSYITTRILIILLIITLYYFFLILSSSARVKSTSHEYRPRYLFTVLNASPPVRYKCSRYDSLDFPQFLLRVILCKYCSSCLERLSGCNLSFTSITSGHYRCWHLSSWAKRT